MKGKIIPITLVLSIFVFGCHKPISRADDRGATAAGVTNVIQANQQFALELYSRLKAKGKNIFFSPYSISTALAMTYEGAKGQTADEMRSVLHFPKDANIRRPSFAKIHNLINKKDKKYKLYTANALWTQKDHPFLKEYTDLIQRYYTGKTTPLDFANETDSRNTINRWVEDQTNNKIKDLIPKGLITPLTRLILTNAIYFKGKWFHPFDKESTKEENFMVNPHKTIKVPMMSITDSRFNYVETNNLQALEMLYNGKELSMLILLPKGNLKSIEDSLDANKLSKLRESLHNEKVHVFLPKFTFKTRYYLSKALKQMGMSTPFTKNADFSGMDGTKSIWINKVIHQAFVEVNEEGTEAAAATAISTKTLAIEETVKIFRADHPFIFIIQERKTGSILFLGRVIHPK